MVQHDEAGAFLEERKEPRLLRVGDRLRHVVEHDHVVAQQVVAIIDIGVLPMLCGGEVDLRIVLEDPEERLGLEPVSAGDEEHFESGRGFFRERDAAEEQRDQPRAEEGRFHSGVIDDHRLDLREQVEPVRPFLAAPAALLEAAPGRGVVEGVVAVDPDRAGVERGGGLVGLADVARPDAGGEAEGRVVALARWRRAGP